MHSAMTSRRVFMHGQLRLRDVLVGRGLGCQGSLLLLVDYTVNCGRVSETGSGTGRAMRGAET